jgi:hypothetical protein
VKQQLAAIRIDIADVVSRPGPPLAFSLAGNASLHAEAALEAALHPP